MVMYFDPNTKVFISLLELGLHARNEKAIVCCPEGFYRRGNVQIMCAIYGIEMVPGLDELAERVKRLVESTG
jgi:hypothetical protein